MTAVVKGLTCGFGSEQSDERVNVLLGVRAPVKDRSNWTATEGSNKNQPFSLYSWQRHLVPGRREIPTHSVQKLQTDKITAGLARRKLQDSYGMLNNGAVVLADFYDTIVILMLLSVVTRCNYIMQLTDYHRSKQENPADARVTCPSF